MASLDWLAEEMESYQPDEDRADNDDPYNSLYDELYEEWCRRQLCDGRAFDGGEYFNLEDE